MNQAKLIDILTQVAPEIAETKDPEKVLLKAASEHNMYPAQLEKLGHAFNQMKTLVALEKQANRGDSFNVLNVQNMVKKYASYDPHKKLSQKDKEVHKKVDNIFKSANDPYAWLADYADEKILNKSASALEGQTIPRKATAKLHKLNELFGMDVEAVEDNMDYEIKQASENSVSELDRYKTIVRHLNEAEKYANTLKSNTYDELEQQAKKFASYIRKAGPEKWAEIVEDAVDRFGVKCASVIEDMETYLQLNHVPYYVADLTKRAFAPVLIKDRHNSWDGLQKMIDIKEMHKEASDALIKIEQDRTAARNKIEELSKQATAVPPIPPGPVNPSPVPQPSPNKPTKKPNIAAALSFMDPIAAANKANDMVGNLVNPLIAGGMVDPKKLQEAQQIGAKNLALQQLILSDPILQEADPIAVEDLYNTIASISPTFAKDKNMMSTALKEAVQYNAVPINMLKDIASFEKDVTDTNLKKKNL